MNKCRFIFLLAAVCTLFSCRQGEVEHNISEMLDAVPTDAVIILPTDRLEQGIDALLDTTDVLRSLDWGHLKGKKAAVSFVYSGSLSPVLCIEAGKASPDTLKDVRRILGNVHELGLVAGHFSGQKTGISHNVLIVCRSEAVLASTIRHLEAGQSVLDAPGFTQVAA